MGASRNFIRGGGARPKKVPHGEKVPKQKKVAERPPHSEKYPQKEKNIAEKSA